MTFAPSAVLPPETSSSRPLPAPVTRSVPAAGLDAPVQVPVVTSSVHELCQPSAIVVPETVNGSHTRGEVPRLPVVHRSPAYTKEVPPVPVTGMMLAVWLVKVLVPAGATGRQAAHGPPSEVAVE